MLETSIDPENWRKEVSKVAHQLSITMKGDKTEIDEIYDRRQYLIEQAKLVGNFSKSNIPELLDLFIENCDQQLNQIKKGEFKLISQNEE